MALGARADGALMRRVLPASIAALALVAVPAHAREAGLWATVNVCDTPSRPAAMGVRVSIPKHGSGQQQWVRIRVEWFDSAAGAWKAMGAGGNAAWKRLGRGKGTVQGGTTFTFQPPAAGQRLVLHGVVEVQWRRKGKVKGRATLPTESGHAKPSDPQLTASGATCEITR
jgi:hypothetical protein